MRIGIGVNENVVISAAGFNDQNTLEVSFVNASAAGATSLSAFDMLSAGDDAAGDSEMFKYMQFVPNVEDMEGNAREGVKIFEDLLHIKNILTHILKRYIPEGKIKFEPFKGIKISGNVSDEKIYNSMKNEKVVKLVYKNICSQFIQMMKPFLNNPKYPSRLLLVRRSVQSHYASIRRRFLNTNPFWESAEVPVAESKLYTRQTKATTKLFEPIDIKGHKFVPNFNAYELSNGLDNPQAPETEDDSTDLELDSDVELSEDMFDVGEEEAPITGSKKAKDKAKVEEEEAVEEEVEEVEEVEETSEEEVEVDVNEDEDDDLDLELDLD